MTNPEIKSYLRNALNIAIQEEESRVTKILDEGRDRIAAGIEKMRPLIVLLNALKDEVGEVKGLTISPAAAGHMASVSTRTSTTDDSLSIGTNYDSTQFEVEHRHYFSVDGTSSNKRTTYPTEDAVMGVAVELVGKHIGAQAAQDAHSKKPKAW